MLPGSYYLAFFVNFVSGLAQVIPLTDAHQTWDGVCGFFNIEEPLDWWVWPDDLFGQKRNWALSDDF